MTIHLEEDQIITAEGAWSTGMRICRVEAVTTPDGLPALAEDIPLERVQSILNEWKVQRVALISYAEPDSLSRKIFAALLIDNRWHDMHGQPLTLAAARGVSATRKEIDWPC